MKRRVIFTFTIIFAFIIGLSTIASLNVERLMKGIFNHYLTPFNAHITQINVSAESLLHWSIPKLTISMNQDQWELHDIDIQFKKDTSLFQLSSSDIQQVTINKITVKLHPLSFTHQVNTLMDQSRAANTSNQKQTLLSPQLLSFLATSPQLHIEQIDVHLNAQDQHQSVPLMAMRSMDLHQGAFSTQLFMNNHPIWTLSGHFTPSQWQFSSHLSFAALAKGLTSLFSELDSFGLTSRLTYGIPINTVNPKSLSAASSAQQTAPLSAALVQTNTEVRHVSQTLFALLHSKLPATGQLTSQINVDLSSSVGADNTQPIFVQSTHQLCDVPFYISPKNMSITALPTSQGRHNIRLHSARYDINKKQQGSNCQASQLQVNITGPITGPTLSIQPVAITLSPNQTQLTELISYLQLSSQLHSLLSQINQADKANKQQNTSLKLVITEPLIFNMTSKKLSLSHANLTWDLGPITTQLTLFELQIMNAFSMNNVSGKWALHTQQYAPIELSLPLLKTGQSNERSRLNKTWKNIEHYDKHHMANITFNQLNLSSQGCIIKQSKNNQIQFTFDTPISLNTGTVTLNNTAHSLALKNNKVMPNDHGYLRTLDVKENQLTIEAGSILRYIPKQKITLTLPPIQLKLNKVNANWQTNTDTSTHKKRADTSSQKLANIEHQGKIKQLHIASSRPIDLVFKLDDTLSFASQSAPLTSHNAMQTFWTAINQPMQQDITVNMDDLLINKASQTSPFHLKSSPLKKTKQRQQLAHINKLSLSQSITSHAKTITSHESWKINDLHLNSQHKVTVDSLANLQAINGKWTFSSPLNELLNVIKETQTEPLDLDITGESQFEISYYKTNSATPWQFALSTHFNDIQGQFKGLPFEGGTLHAQCHFVHHVLHTKKDSLNQLPLQCDTLTLSMDAFNPGIIITDLNIQGTLTQIAPPRLAPLSKDTSTTWQALWAQLGLNQTQLELNLTANTLNGTLAVPEFSLNTKGETKACILLKGVSLHQLLTLHPVEGVYADGLFDAVLPIQFEYDKLTFNNGELTARAPGGLIAINNNPSVEKMKLSQPYLDFAFSALEHLEYHALTSQFNMTSNGDAILKAHIEGKSRGVTRPIVFNYTQEENLLQLLRSLQLSGKLQSEIEKSIK
ncbi:YdbH domain-containing protein [uncultured Shewanella sp.]|uniref:intermembrane phospholipid transport protein YdbH family protein n=1 Tax=uncultured Shewanella sp. TaxID=173975 RepID=UPI0026027724|nr:YdbH domain-containing protein [uncultured Shewanella sp.]